MRLFSKLKIFFRLKKEEIVDFIKYNDHVQGIFATIVACLVVGLIGVSISFLVGGIAQLIQPYEWWTKFFGAQSNIDNIFILGSILSLFIVFWGIAIGIAYYVLLHLPYKFIKWVYSNWQMAEKEVTRLEDKKRIKK